MAQNTTAAAEVVRLAIADPAVLAAANDLITAAKTSVLTGGLTTFDVTALLADPKLQAAAVPLITTASAAAGPAWLAVLPQATPVAKVRHCILPLENMNAEHRSAEDQCS